MSERKEGILAGIAAATTVFAGVFTWTGFDISGTRQWTFPVVFTVVEIAGWTWAFYRRRKSRPFLIGSVTGFGAALLICIL